jgi:hypothetical protein
MSVSSARFIVLLSCFGMVESADHEWGSESVVPFSADGEIMGYRESLLRLGLYMDGHIIGMWMIGL